MGEQAASEHEVPVRHRLIWNQKIACAMLGLRGVGAFSRLVADDLAPKPIALRASGQKMWRAAELRDWVLDGCRPAFAWQWEADRGGAQNARIRALESKIDALESRLARLEPDR